MLISQCRYLEALNIFFKDMVEEKSLREIFDAVRSELNQEISNEALLNEVKNVCIPLLNTNVLLLKSKDC